MSAIPVIRPISDRQAATASRVDIGAPVPVPNSCTRCGRSQDTERSGTSPARQTPNGAGVTPVANELTYDPEYSSRSGETMAQALHRGSAMSLFGVLSTAANRSPVDADQTPPAAALTCERACSWYSRATVPHHWMSDVVPSSSTACVGSLRYATTSPRCSPAQSEKLTSDSPMLPTGADGGSPDPSSPLTASRQSPTAGALKPGGPTAVPPTGIPPTLAISKAQSTARASTATPATRRVTPPG